MAIPFFANKFSTLPRIKPPIVKIKKDHEQSEFDDWCGTGRPPFGGKPPIIVKVKKDHEEAELDTI